MGERDSGCPLGSGQVWDNDIPSKCQDCIENFAIALPVTDTDVFNDDCDHPLEWGGQTLQRLDDSKSPRRLLGTLLNCMDYYDGDHGEVMAEHTVFSCPRDK